MKFKAQKMKMVGVKFTAIFGTENRVSTVKLGDKEQIGVKEPFPLTTVVLQYRQ